MKKENDVSEAFFRLTGSNAVDDSSLNPYDWLGIIELSLKSCEKFLKEIASENREARPLKGFLNCNVTKGEHGEKRITSPEVLETLQIINEKDLFIPIKILETSEKKGQFLERRLFIAPDIASLIILDVNFRKVPQPNQRLGENFPKINEEVVSVFVVSDKETDKFNELAIPYFSKTTLGREIIEHYLKGIINKVRESREKAEKDRKTAETFITIRERLGIYNNL